MEPSSQKPTIRKVAPPDVYAVAPALAEYTDRVLFGDFKTHRRPPASVAATPVAYLRQMASYRAVLRVIFPGRAVIATLIWTREGRVMTLPDALLDPHHPGLG